MPGGWPPWTPISARPSFRGQSQNKVYPGQFKYGGAHVIEDLVAGPFRAPAALQSYGTDCYPRQQPRPARSRWPICPTRSFSSIRATATRTTTPR
ncbi:MAG: homocysteine biosynthesis protein [Bilophila sp.]